MVKPRKIPPGRQQYLAIKSQYPDALLLFRMGDFYETFDDDAVTMAKILDIALTTRDIGGGQKSPLAGIPYHALDAYLSRLVKSGLKIAIAEQTSTPAESQGIVDREVIRIVTPGTVLDEAMLQPDRNNYLTAVVVEGDDVGLACLELTTSDFFTMQLDRNQLMAELTGLSPAEILVNGAAKELLSSADYLLRDVLPQDVALDSAERALKKQFGVIDLEAFGCKGDTEATIAAYLVLKYAKETQRGNLPQLTKLRTVSSNTHVLVDKHAIRDLELFDSANGTANTLFSVLNFCATPPGSRKLRHWILHPLRELNEINRRQEITNELLSNATALMQLNEALKKIGDLERITNRLYRGAAGPRDLVQLHTALTQIPARC